MIISKTPFRIPFAGGLTDLRPYATEYGGITVSVTINKYVRIYLEKHEGKGFHIEYLDRIESVEDFDSIEHKIIKTAIDMLELTEEPLRMKVISDFPTNSGLGSSGAFTVGILNVLHAYKNELVPQRKLAKEAAKIEIEILNGSCGDHVPYICSRGGLKKILSDGSKPLFHSIKLSKRGWYELQKRIILFYTGFSNDTNSSLGKLKENLKMNLEILHKIRKIGYTAADSLERENFTTFYDMFEKQQENKMQLTGNFFSKEIDDMIKNFRKIGCKSQIPGGKIGSFIIVLSDIEQIEKTLEIGKRLGLEKVDFMFEKEGSVLMKQE